MLSLRRSLLVLASFSTAATSIQAATTATYGEIPYYIRQLEQTDVESKRMECNKIIHEAVVHADLSDRKVVKKMEPTVVKIRAAMAAGLDRPYLDNTMWLATAVDYFEREKNRPIVDIPETDWMPAQSTALNGTKISTFPDRIMLTENEKTKAIAESSNIYEAVISPDAKKAAFFRRTDESSDAEVWVINLKTLKRKKITEIASCETILFSLDGDSLFLQEKPKSSSEEATVRRISSNGGNAKAIGTARTVETLVAKGRYMGSLIVFKITKHHLGTTQNDCAVAWKESGVEVGRLKNGPCR